MSDEETKSWIYAGGLPYELTEGDILCVFSQYGEILEISLSRDKDTGKSRGFCFIKYEDSRSCELAVDNFNGASIVGRKIKVSYANNINALKSRKPAIVAPPSPARSQRDRKSDNRHRSPEKDRSSKHRRHRHRSPEKDRSSKHRRHRHRSPEKDRSSKHRRHRHRSPEKDSSSKHRRHRHRSPEKDRSSKHRRH